MDVDSMGAINSHSLNVRVQSPVFSAPHNPVLIEVMFFKLPHLNSETFVSSAYREIVWRDRCEGEVQFWTNGNEGLEWSCCG